VTATIQTAQSANSPETVYTKFKLVNTTLASDIGGTETFSAFAFINTAVVTANQVTVNAVAHVGLGETVSVEGIAVAPQAGVTAGLAWATVTAASLSWVRIA
jgi:hypothetical protein